MIEKSQSRSVMKGVPRCKSLSFSLPPIPLECPSWWTALSTRSPLFIREGTSSRCTTRARKGKGYGKGKGKRTWSGRSSRRFIGTDGCSTSTRQQWKGRDKREYHHNQRKIWCRWGGGEGGGQTIWGMWKSRSLDCPYPEVQNSPFARVLRNRFQLLREEQAAGSFWSGILGNITIL